MKIAIVCLNLSWQSGGPRLIFSLAQMLKKQGNAVVIYTPEFGGKYFKELWTGLDIRVVPTSQITWTGRPKNIISWIQRKIEQERSRNEAVKKIAAAMDADFDVVNVHDFAYTLGFFYKKRNPKSRVLWTENDPPYMYLPKKNPIFSLLSRIYNATKDITSRRYFRAIDKVSVLDFHNKKWCEARGLTPSVVRLGVDADNFYLPVKDFSHHADAKKIQLFALGSLNEYRRYEDTILAVKELKDRGYDARLKIIANDMWNERAYREKILALIKENNLEPAIDIRFEGVSEEGLRNAYKESDVFVYSVYVPAPRNGFGFSIGVFEAMAAGLPVVLCRTTTSTEVLEDRKTALFVDPMSPAQIADKIAYLIDNPKQYQSIALAGQKFVKENLTWEKYTNEILNLIKNK